MVIEFHNHQALDTPTHVALCRAKIWYIVVEGVHVHTYSDDVGQGVNNKVEGSVEEEKPRNVAWRLTVRVDLNEFTV